MPVLITLLPDTMVDLMKGGHDPSETFNHTHRYSSYLLGLTKNWAYSTRTPGRTMTEKRLVELNRSVAT